MANTPKKNIKVLMGGMNAKIDQNNKNRERIIWKHSIGKINKINDRLAQFCGTNNKWRKHKEEAYSPHKHPQNNLESCTQRQNKESNKLRHDK